MQKYQTSLWISGRQTTKKETERKTEIGDAAGKTKKTDDHLFKMQW